MNKFLRLNLLLFYTFMLSNGNAATNRAAERGLPKDTPVTFSADWISHPDINLKEYGVFHLRKVFDLAEKPSQFIIHVSGDNRYRLFVNGKQVCQGPARGDLRNWKYETLDIAPYLKAGRNVLAALLWNMGSGGPAAQISYQTGFILQGNSETENLVNTNTSWRITRNNGYFPEVIPPSKLASYIVGSCDSINFKEYPWRWEQLNFDDSNWKTPVSEKKTRYFNEKRILVPRNIPLLEEKAESITGLVRLSGISMNKLQSAGDGSLYFPAHTTAEVLFDRQTLTTAYPEITFSKGANSHVQITYAESLFDAKNLKGDRNATEGKTIKGYYDVFLPDGSTSEHLFKPLWIRTFRYIQLNITTTDEPLVINKMQSVFTAYPFKEVGSFTSNDKSLDKIWEVGWRTARLCAGETYMDCPYYEQLQYIGDTRIQALISLYVTGDDQLMRNAIEQFHQSQVPDGLTKDAYPCGDSKIITPFSLFLVSMIHDYCWYRNDKAFIEKYLIPMEAILKWFEYRIDPTTGLLGKLGYWNFVDWSFPYKGVPPGGMEGQSSILSLQYVYSLEQAVEIYTLFNQTEKAMYYKNIADKIKKAVVSSCFDSGKMLIADTPEKQNFSQHANIWSIINGCIPEKDYQSTMEKIINDKSLTQSSIYYRFYYTKALKKSGLGNLYLSELGPWNDMIDLGLSTFPETTSPRTRSDCHAWSASPCFDFLATVCGIEPEDFGFHSVRIEPNPGNLTNFEGCVPHALGIIKFSCKKLAEEKYQATIELPENLEGHFVWKGKTSKLRSGKQTFSF